MRKSPGDEMLYKYCQSVIINHSKAICFVTEGTDKSKTTHSALNKGNQRKEYLVIVGKENGGGVVFRTAEAEYKGTVNVMTMWGKQSK